MLRCNTRLDCCSANRNVYARPVKDTLSGMTVTDDAPQSQQAAAKQRQILDGARAVFRQLGFDAASMGEIAKAAGVSKGTLYVYFPSKEALFAEMVKVDRNQAVEQLFAFDPANPDVAAVLTQLGRSFVSRILVPEKLAVLQMVVGIAARQPELGRAFYDSGPGLGQKRLAAYLQAQADAGVLRMADAELAAGLFLSMCREPMFCAVIVGAAPPADAERSERMVAEAVRCFMAAYGAS